MRTDAFSSRLPVLVAGLLLLTPGCEAKVAAGSTPPVDPSPAQPEPEPAPEPITAKTLLESTVLVATPWGHGTGVIVDERGWVLTNYHVISSGKNQDFGYEATVTTAKMQDDGSMVVDEKLEAVVLKVDPDRDLAVLAIKEPSGSFATLARAPKGPIPGSGVSAIGNAGVGFGWAIKKCSVNAVGTFENFATAIFAQQREDGRSDEELAKAKDEIEEASKKNGKQVQTDCNVLPGDSGGPLVDGETGELVGLNVAIRPATAGFATLGSVAFHVHIDEVNDFLAEVPESPEANLPDPWEVAGKFGRFQDFDEDGEIDTLRFEGLCEGGMYCFSVLADLDQSSFKKRKKVPEVEKIHESREFDAELAAVRVARPPRDVQHGLPVSDLLVFVNADSAGPYDKLVVVDGESHKTRGYAIKGEPGAWSVERDSTLDDFELTNIGDLYEKKRLKTLASRFVANMAGGGSDVKNPDKAKALEASFRDATGDGKLDTLMARTRMDSRVLIDLDQNQFGKVAKRVAKKAEQAAAKEDAKRDAEQIADAKLLKKLRNGKIHGEFLAVLGSPVKVFYDTDHDGAYDLLLEGDSLDRGVALGASRLDSSGRRTPAPEHLGRRLLRPGLISEPEYAQRLEAVFSKTFADQPRAEVEDGHSSFPEFDPSRVVVANRIPDLGERALSVLDRAAMSLVVDLDGKSKKKTKSKKDWELTEFVRKGGFESEFVFRTDGRLAWAYYDTNNDGKLDRVFVSRPGDPRHIGAAFSFDGQGVVTVDAGMAGKDMFQAELFKNKAHRKAFTDVKKKTVDSGRF
ncbi:MAG: S1C family serine protease [Nannocystales bacterium]